MVGEFGAQGTLDQGLFERYGGGIDRLGRSWGH